MADPYLYKYAGLERDLRSASAIPGYLPSEGSALSSRYFLDGSNLPASTELPQNDLLSLRPRYHLDDFAAVGSRASPGIGGLAAGASTRALTPLEDPALLRRDVALGVKPGSIDFERPDLRKSEGLLADESNILYVDGLPKDCTRREVGHLFRPFIGFKEIRVVHKEARRPADKAYVLCFVEFKDSKCALTVLEALQGYKFDDKKPDAPALRIQFAKFPFRPPNQE